jgi:hypothetical protein
MKPSVTIPREKLAELLQASGSALTPEEYTASLPGTGSHRKYPSRARAAAWSKNVLIFVLILSVLFTFTDFGIENILIIIGLGAVTFFETRVHRYFWDDDPAAPELGFRNQGGFAAGILVYGLYHAFVPSQIPPEYKDLIDPSMIGTLQAMERISYLVIGIVGGVSQFALAWYYRSAGGSEAI